jgi:hypothetical protein
VGAQTNTDQEQVPGVGTCAPSGALAGRLDELVCGLLEIPDVQLPECLAGAARQLNRALAVQLTFAWETAQRDGLGDGPASVSRIDAPDEGSVHEVRIALKLTTREAGSLLHFAQGVIERHPPLIAAMWAGDLDHERAKAFVSGTAELPDDLARS